MIKLLVNTYWQSTIKNGQSFLQTNVEEKTQLAKTLVTFFYLLVVYVSIQSFSRFCPFPNWELLLDSSHMFLPNWNVKWVDVNNWEFYVRSIFLFLLVCSLLGVIAWQRSRIIRFLVFLGLFFYIGLIYSFGKIDHYLHIMLIAAFMLIFLPNKNESKSGSSDFLKVFFSIQTLILLTYFVSGFFKIVGIIQQVIAGEVSALSPEGFGQHVGLTSFIINSDFFFSDYILNNPSPFLAIILVSGFLIELLSIYIIFQPKLHRIWGLFLILLHTGILLTVGPDFTKQILMVGVFLLLSPFTSTKIDLWQDFIDAFRWMKGWFKKSNTTNDVAIFYNESNLKSQRLISDFSKDGLPAQTNIYSQQSINFTDLLNDYPALKEIDSLVIVENNENEKPIIRLKADGNNWLLAKLKKPNLILKALYFISPFLGNLIYDVTNRKFQNKP